MAIKLIETDRFRSKVKSSDYTMVFFSNITIDNSIKFSMSHGATDRSKFIKEGFDFLKILSDG